MKRSTLTLLFGGGPQTLPQSCLALLLLCSLVVAARAADFPGPRQPFSDQQLRERLRWFNQTRPSAEQLQQAHSLLKEGWLSSLQVKAIAKTFPQEDARFDFALAAYPRTVDPENFYEVYDVFTSFSKAFRLHDQIRELRASNAPPVRVAFQPVSDEAMADLLKAIRAEGFEDSKKTLARQVFTGQRRFLSRQVCDIVKVFAFDDGRLEIAKLAFDSVIDPENYYLVNQAFSFPNTKNDLARFIESRRQERQPRPAR